MGNARTQTTGTSKLVNKHPVHLMLDESVYKDLVKFAHEEGLTATTMARRLVEQFVLKKTMDATRKADKAKMEDKMSSPVRPEMR